MAQAKRKVRELAMQVLYTWDVHGQLDETMGRQVTHDGSDDPVTRQRAYDMAAGAWEQRATIDQWIERLAPQWPPRRQPQVDRNLLRLAVWELTNTATPPKVVLDEAIELAKEFSTEQSSAFVNGVLDAVLREHQALKEGNVMT
jgi:N utilization substance protein B